MVTTVAGSGSPGHADGFASGCAFVDPFGMAVSPDGTVYISDAGDTNAIRRMKPDGTVDTLAGGQEGRADGTGPSAMFNTPSAIALAPDGSLVVADTQNHSIRRVTPDGIVTTVAGTGEPGRVDGPAGLARFDGPTGVAVSSTGTIVVADTYNDAVRLISPEGSVSTLAGGGGPGLVDGVGADARFNSPAGVAIDSDGIIFVADTGNDALRRIDRDGRVTTLVLGAPTSGLTPIPPVRPIGIAVTNDHLLYVTDALGRVLVVHADLTAEVVAGSTNGFADGSGASARFGALAGIAVTPGGTAFVADPENALVRALTPPGKTRPAGDIFLFPVPLLTPASLHLDHLPWPVDPQEGWHELTATLGEARGSIGGDGRERLHAGVDVHADVGAFVRAVRSEKVSRIVPVSGVGELNEMIRVGLMAYVHVRAGRDRRDRPVDAQRFEVIDDEKGKPARVRVRRGTRFNEGDVIGTANRFAHVHLGMGPHAGEVNALAFSLPLFSDHVAPTIPARGLQFLDEWGSRFPVEKGRPVVNGRVAIVAEAWDQVDGNEKRRRLGVYAMGYQVLRQDGTPLPGFEEPKNTICFDRLPSTPGAGRLAYEEGSGITVYGNRSTRFRYVVTNEVRDGEAGPGWWDTTGLPPGRYKVRVLARDFSGNTASREVEVGVK